MQVSYAPNGRYSGVRRIELKEIIDMLQTENKSVIKKIRMSNNKEEARELKNSLPAFSVSLFSETKQSDRHKTNRNNKDFISASMISIDIDHIAEPWERNLTIDPSEIKWIKNDITEYNTLSDSIVAAFRSPSGDGLKLLVRITPVYSCRDYTSAWNYIAELVRDEMQLEPDQSTKDASRLIYMSYDPELYYNPDAVNIDVSTIIDSIALSVNDQSLTQITTEQEQIVLDIARQIRVEHYKQFRDFCSAASRLGRNFLQTFYSNMYNTSEQYLSDETREALREKEKYINSFMTDHNRVSIDRVLQYAVELGFDFTKYKNISFNNKEMFDISKKKQSIIKYMNDRYAAYNYGEGVIVLPDKKIGTIDMMSGAQPQRKEDGIRIIKTANFKMAMQNCKLYYLDGKGKQNSISYFDIWWNSTKRRDVSNIRIVPHQLKSSDLCIWNGFNVDEEQYAIADWRDAAPILEFIYDIIANKQKDVYEYVIWWVADMLQNPTNKNKPGVALVLRSTKEGTGKGTFYEILLDLIGPVHATQTETISDVTGNFNSALENKLLVCLNEAFYSKDQAINKKLMSMITESTMRIRRKFIEGFETENICRFLITSNDDHVVNMATSSRRFFVTSVSEERAQDVKYFTKIREEMRQNKAALLKFFLEIVKVKREKLKTARVRTPEMRLQIIESFNSVDKWIVNKLLIWKIHHDKKDGTRFTYNLQKNAVTEMPFEAVISDYRLFCRETVERYPVSDTQLIRMLKKNIPQIEIKRQRMGKVMDNIVVLPSISDLFETLPYHRPEDWEKMVVDEYQPEEWETMFNDEEDIPF